MQNKLKLSEITDEHAVEVAKIVAPNIQDLHHLKNIGTNVIIDISNGHTIIEVGAITFTAVIDYLRYKHYDLGYMHIPSLITAGLAINKTI